MWDGGGVKVETGDQSRGYCKVLVRDDGGLGQRGIRGGGRKWSDSGHIWKVESSRCADG